MGIAFVRPVGGTSNANVVVGVAGHSVQEVEVLEGEGDGGGAMRVVGILGTPPGAIQGTSVRMEYGSRISLRATRTLRAAGENGERVMRV